MNEDIFYKVETQKSKCSCCGKSIKNIYKYKGQDYGYYCFMNKIGSPVDRSISKEKPLPNWAFDLMNEYFNKTKDSCLYESSSIYDDFVVDFFNEYISKEYEDHPLWCRVTEIAGRNIPVYQQHMISDYLVMRLKQYRQENGLV